MTTKSFRKIMALFLTLAMVVSLFAGLGISASAAASSTVSIVVKDSNDTERTIATWTYDTHNATYTDDATSAELAIVTDFTDAANQTGTVNGTSYDFTALGALAYTGANKKPDCRALAVTTKGILLEELIDYAETASGLSLRGDTKLLFTDGSASTNEYTYTEYWGQTKYYYPAWYAAGEQSAGTVTTEQQAGGIAVPTTLAIKGYHAATNGVIATMISTADDFNAPRITIGQQQGGADNNLDANLGFNSVKNVNKIIFTLPVTFDEAENSGDPDSLVWDGTLDFRWYDEGDVKTEYHITTPAQWAALAWICSEHLSDLKTANDNGLGAGTYTNGNITAISGTIPTNQNPFPDVQFYLDNDIDMGGVYDSSTQAWSGPQYYPVGSQALNDLGTACFYGLFYGSFDGQGYVVSNIYCDRGTGMNAQSAALFGRVGAADGVNHAHSDIVIENVAVTGYIKAGRSVGGIVGKTLDSANSNSITVRNCLNFADIASTDSKGTGGVVGAGWNTNYINNCANFGTVIAGYKNGGGISGSFEGTSNNCYNVGDISKSATNNGQAFGTSNSASSHVYNFYWLTGTSNSTNMTGLNGAIFSPKTGDTAFEITDHYNGSELSAVEYMKSDEFLTKLNNGTEAWVFLKGNTKAISPQLEALADGYPVPKTMTIEHTYKSEWETDSTHHWHACNTAGCTDIDAKDEHMWDSGAVTLEPTANTSGVKTYICSVCSFARNESIPATGTGGRLCGHFRPESDLNSLGWYYG